MQEGVDLSIGNFTGGVLILSRIIGHSEFEPAKPPMFPKEKVEKARFDLEEAEKIKKEIQTYGGKLAKGGLIVPVEDIAESMTSESVSKRDTSNDLNHVMNDPHYRRASMFESPKA